MGGRLAHFLEQLGELTNNKWVLSIIRDGFRIPFRPTPHSFVSSDKSESIFLPVSTRRDRGTSPETVSGKGTRSGNFRFLFPVIFCSKNERKVTSGSSSFSAKSIHKETIIQDGDSQFCTTIDIGQQLDCCHKPDRCLPTCSDSPSIQKVSSLHVRRSDLPVHGLTLRNVPKSVDFHQTDGSNSSALASTCHPIISVPRRLAHKRSNSQPASISYNILPSNGAESRVYSRSKEIRFDTSQKFTFIGMEFLTQQNIVRVPADRIDSLLLTIKLFLSQTQVLARTFPSLLGKRSAEEDLVLLGRLHLRPLPNVSLICLETSHSSSRSSNSDQQDDSIPFEMVDGHQSLRSGNVHSSSRSKFIPLYGCQQLRMRSSSRAEETILSWSLVGRQVTA